MKTGYRQWLEAQKYDASTITAQMYRASRVEDRALARDSLPHLTLPGAFRQP